MSNKLDLNFSDLPTIPAGKAKPDAAVVKEVARTAGAAEGFTDRVPVTTPVEPPVPPVTAPVKQVRHLRPPTIQMNLKVPEAFRAAFMEAYEQEAAKNRAIRSLADFLDLVFAEWQAGKRGKRSV